MHAPHDWLRRHANRWESSVPEVPLSQGERQALDGIFGNARIIGLGEMTHGSRPVVRARDRILRHWVRSCGGTVVVMESCFAATQAVDEAVSNRAASLDRALAATGYWSIANHETLQMASWLREHNGSVPEPARVQIWGSDVQGLDATKAALDRFVTRWVGDGLLSLEDERRTKAALAGLPSDSRLHDHISAFMEAWTTAVPDEATNLRLEERRGEYQKNMFRAVEDALSVFGDIDFKIACADRQSRFVFRRCVRLLDQIVQVAAPDFRKRDAFLAENVGELAEFFSDRKVALLFANVHLARVPIEIQGSEFIPMGLHLAHRWGNDYRAMAAAFYQGDYLAIVGDGGDERIERAHVPRSDSFEGALRAFAEASGQADFLLDARDAASPWREPIDMRLGEAGPQATYEATFLAQRPHRQYDGILFLTRSEPTSVLEAYRKRALNGARP